MKALCFMLATCCSFCSFAKRRVGIPSWVVLTICLALVLVCAFFVRVYYTVTCWCGKSSSCKRVSSGSSSNDLGLFRPYVNTCDTLHHSDFSFSMSRSFSAILPQIFRTLNVLSYPLLDFRFHLIFVTFQPRIAALPCTFIRRKCDLTFWSL